MSSGATSSAGGGFRPIRCKEARTSAITERRLVSERLIASSAPVNVSSRELGLADLAFTRGGVLGRVEERGRELRPVGSDGGNLRFDLPPLLLRRLDRVLHAAQLKPVAAQLRVFFVQIRRRGGRGRGGGANSGEAHETEFQRGEADCPCESIFAGPCLKRHNVSFGCGGRKRPRGSKSCEGQTGQQKVAPSRQGHKKARIILVPVIGMTGKNRHGPVNLFGGHDSCQLMRPRHRSKRKRERRRGQKCGVQSVRAANDKGGAGARGVPPLAKLGGQATACHLFAGFVERDNGKARWEQGAQGFRLVPLAIIRAGRAAFRRLAQFNPGKPDCAAGGCGPRDIMRRQIPLGSGFRPPDASKQETHRTARLRA